MSRKIKALGAALLLGSAPSAWAQEVDEVVVPDDSETIVVRAYSSRGTVRGNIPSELELDAEDIAAYGSSSIDELLEALGPSVSSARGRGDGGRPIILINGQRISGFREIRDLPPEAIERVQVFPEELALAYGFRPDQRVVNFILVENYRSIAVEGEHGESTAGGYAVSEIDTTLTRISDAGRLNLDVEYQRSSELTEAERDIVQPRTSDFGIVDDGQFRSLIASSDRLELTASWSSKLSDTTSLSLSGEFQHQESEDRLGLTDVDLLVPADSPFAQGAQDQSVYRFLPAAGALQRNVSQDGGELGVTVNGLLSDWAWTLTGNYTRNETRTRTDREPDTSGLAAAILAGDAAVDPFDPALGAALVPDLDTARSTSQTADGELTVSGSPLILPAGEVSVSATTGVEWLAVDSRAVRNGIETSTDPERSRAFARGNVDIPLTSRRDDVLAGIGDLSVNANAGYAELSDFGGLTEYGYGLTWEPTESLTLIASVIGEEVAPSVQDLGGPLIVTPNVATFDFTRGESVLIDRISGGNSALIAESRKDLKISASYAPGGSRDRRFSIEYVSNRSDDVTSAFPALTAEIEAAFPDRVVRDAGGGLVSVDARPVTFSEVRSERLRTGIDFSGRIAGGGENERSSGAARPGRTRAAPPTPPQRSAAAADGADATQDEEPPTNRGNRGEGTPTEPGRSSEDQPSSDGAAPAAPAPNPRAAMFGGGDRGRGRWQLSLYHTWRLSETVLIRPGVAELDLLGGSITDGRTPLAEHSVELTGGVFMDGFGARLSGNYTGSARIDGSEVTGSTDLSFGDIFTMDLRTFYTLDRDPEWVERFPFLANSRISLNIENIFGGVRRVEDGAGNVPLNFQPGFLNPEGRFVELSFRKRF
ncbi:hypothetical protein ACSMXM_02190 [Pacificimonas sp. ICDLI1SI03]